MPPWDRETACTCTYNFESDGHGDTASTGNTLFDHVCRYLSQYVLVLSLFFCMVEVCDAIIKSNDVWRRWRVFTLMIPFI